MKKNVKGFSLIEVLIVIGFMSILMAIAYPSFSQWQKNAQYKEGVRQLASAMMEARSRAIGQNLEHELAFDLGTNTYMLRQGNRASSTRSYSSYPGDWEKIYSNRSLSSLIDIKGKTDCSDNSAVDFRIQFFPNGTAKVNGIEDMGSWGNVCIMAKITGEKKYQAGVSSSATGRVVIRKWNQSSNSWD